MSSFEKLCSNVSALLLTISPANIDDSYIFLITSFGALLPILMRLCSRKYVFILFMDFFLSSFCASRILFLVPLSLIRTETVLFILDFPSVYFLLIVFFVIFLLFWTTKVPSFLFYMICKAFFIFKFSLTKGILFPVIINSSTVLSLVPRFPEGWNFLKSFLLILFLFSVDT